MLSQKGNQSVTEPAEPEERMENFIGHFVDYKRVGCACHGLARAIYKDKLKQTDNISRDCRSGLMRR